MQGIEKIRKVKPKLAKNIEDRGGFLLETEIPDLERIDRLMLILVRCGNGRFLCPAQNVAWFIGIIEEHAKFKKKETGEEFAGEYVRDVSLPA